METTAKATEQSCSDIVPDDAEVIAEAPEYSEDALALTFSDLHPRLRYTEKRKTWHRFDGYYWRQDSTLEVYDEIRSTLRNISSTLGKDKASIAKRIASAVTIANVEKIAKSDRRHSTREEDWDTRGMELNTPEGTVELTTGRLLDPNPEALHSKATTVRPSIGKPARWLEFLERVTAGDQALQAYLRRVSGYCLTAEVSEQALFFLFGSGQNGKGVFLQTLSQILGDYAKGCAPEIFTLQKFEKHPTALAGLVGSRLVTAGEIESGAELALGQIKALTGGEEKIRARLMRCDFFDFIPRFKLILSGNSKPVLRTVDKAIRRRVHMIPFRVEIPDGERDPMLPKKLETEHGQILQWAIEGCLEWQRQGLNPPAIVREATEEYLSSEDTQGRWIAEECESIKTVLHTPVALLYTRYKGWCDSNHEPCPSMKSFSQSLESRGFKRSTNRQARGFAGIGLRSEFRREH